MKKEEKPKRSLEGNFIPVQGWAGLAGAIIEWAIRDIKVPEKSIRILPDDRVSVRNYKNKLRANKRSAIRFFSSHWSGALADLAEIDPDMLQEAVADILAAGGAENWDAGRARETQRDSKSGSSRHCAELLKHG